MDFTNHDLSLPRTMTFISTKTRGRDQHPRLSHHNSIPTKTMARYQSDLTIGASGPGSVPSKTKPVFSSASSWRNEEDRAKAHSNNKGIGPLRSEGKAGVSDNRGRGDRPQVEARNSKGRVLYK